MVWNLLVMASFEYSSDDVWCEGIKMWETTYNINQGTSRAWRPFNKPFYLNFTIKILDWYLSFGFSPSWHDQLSKNGAIFEINQNVICWWNPWFLCLNLCLPSHILVMLDVILGPKMCKARCFPLVALVWDPSYGLEITPKFTTATIVIDSSPTIWGLIYGFEHTTIVLLVHFARTP
jgi:hypothetical protein